MSAVYFYSSCAMIFLDTVTWWTLVIQAVLLNRLGSCQFHQPWTVPVKSPLWSLLKSSFMSLLSASLLIYRRLRFIKNLSPFYSSFKKKKGGPIFLTKYNLRHYTDHELTNLIFFTCFIINLLNLANYVFLD